MLRAIRSNFHLTRVAIDEFGSSCSSEEDTGGYQLDKKELEALQNGPRINQLRRSLKLSSDNTYNGKLEPWVEAMISFQDQHDCFHFFLSQLPPETYLHSDHWEKPKQHDHNNSRKRKQSHVQNQRSKKKATQPTITKADNPHTTASTSSTTSQNLLHLFMGSGCSQRRPVCLSSFLSNTSSWR